MIVFLLFACTEPPVLDAVSEELASRAIGGGEDALRMGTAVAGVVSETCGIDVTDGYVFTGGGATAIAAGIVSVTGEINQVWTWTGVGLDGAEGTLILTPDTSGKDFAIEYDGDTVTFTAGFERTTCETDGSRAVVEGTGTWATADSSTTIDLVGEAPNNGLGFVPPTALAPSSGQLKWTDDTDGYVILLDDASTIDLDAGTWPGNANGKDWSFDVDVPLP